MLSVSLRLLLLLLHYCHQRHVALLQHHLLLVDDRGQLLRFLLYQGILSITEVAGLLGITLHEESSTVFDQVEPLTLCINWWCVHYVHCPDALG